MRARREEGLRGAALLAAAIAIGIAYAALDEFHQVFVPSRTASPHDVVVDAAGVIVGALLAVSGRIRLLGSPAQN